MSGLEKLKILHRNIIFHNKKKTIVPCNITNNYLKTDAVFKLFSKSLFVWITQWSNQRSEIVEKTFKRNIQKTSSAEIMIMLGCSLIMNYNRLPAYKMYWSNRKYLDNDKMKSVIFKERFQLFLSKLYFNNPEKNK